MNKEPLIKYARVIDRNRLVLFLGLATTDINPFQFVLTRLTIQSIFLAKESKETLAGKMVPCIEVPFTSPVKNFEFKQNFKTNVTVLFVYCENESGATINLPTYL